MKNLFKVITFSLVMLFGITNVSAQKLSQNQDRPEVVAKSKVAQLSKTLDLTGDQERSVFRALVAQEVNYRKHINGKSLSDATVAANKKKYDDALKASMKKHLTATQFKKWLDMQQM